MTRSASTSPAESGWWNAEPVTALRLRAATPEDAGPLTDLSDPHALAGVSFIRRWLRPIITCVRICPEPFIGPPMPIVAPE